jgi:hypothetical protein
VRQYEAFYRSYTRGLTEREKLTVVGHNTDIKINKNGLEVTTLKTTFVDKNQSFERDIYVLGKNLSLPSGTNINAHLFCNVLLAMRCGMKMTRKRLEIALAYNWPLSSFYRFAPVAISYLFGVYHQPLPYEKLNLFVASLETESEAICENIQSEICRSELKRSQQSQSQIQACHFQSKAESVAIIG